MVGATKPSRACAKFICGALGTPPGTVGTDMGVPYDMIDDVRRWTFLLDGRGVDIASDALFERETRWRDDARGMRG